MKDTDHNAVDETDVMDPIHEPVPDPEPVPEPEQASTTEPVPEPEPEPEQKHVLLFGCPKDELPVNRSFSTLRVGLKWADRVKAGDILQMSGAPNPMTGDAGDDYGLALVEKVDTYVSFRQALQASGRTNHFCLLGKSMIALEELIIRIHPENVVKQAKGFVVITLKPMSAPSEL